MNKCLLKYLLGYGLSVVVATPVTYWWSRFLHRAIQDHRTPNDPEAERIPWIPIMLGIFERAIITTLVGWKVPGTAGFIGAWVAVKSAGGWASWSKGTTYGRAVLFIGLLGSAMSVLFALAGGLIIAPK
jgi:hypothetical protein